MKMTARISPLSYIICLIVAYLHLDAFSRANVLRLAVVGLIDVIVLATFAVRFGSRAASQEQVTSAIAHEGDRTIVLGSAVRLDDLARAIQIKPFVLVGELMNMNIFVHKRSTLPRDVAKMIAERHGWAVIDRVEK